MALWQEGGEGEGENGRYTIPVSLTAGPWEGVYWKKREGCGW